MSNTDTSVSSVEKAKAEFSAGVLDLIREACDPSYRDLAKRSGVSKTTICRIVTDGHFPKWTTLRDLLIALEVDEEEIRTTWKRRWIDTQDVIKPRPGRTQPSATTQDPENTPKPVLHVLNSRRNTTALRPVAQA
jgi:transcriptional regulator with XRE-family HTH domain